MIAQIKNYPKDNEQRRCRRGMNGEYLGCTAGQGLQVIQK